MTGEKCDICQGKGFTITGGQDPYTPAVCPKCLSTAAAPLEPVDEFTVQAAFLTAREGRASTSLIQRHFRIGYTRAARIMKELEAFGVVGPQKGTDPRDVFPRDDWEKGFPPPTEYLAPPELPAFPKIDEIPGVRLEALDEVARFRKEDAAATFAPAGAVQVGSFFLSRGSRPGTIWIQDIFGEGGEFDESSLAKQIEAFYEREF